MKENVKSVIVLTVISVVVAALLSVTNFFTAPIIEANKAAAASASLKIVMPEGKGFDEVDLPADAPSTVTAMYKESSGQGYVFLLTTKSQYSSDDMGITVGIGSDGTIKGVTITSYFESKDFGSDYPQTYVGCDSALNGVDTFAGITYSSTAFKNAILDAFNVLISSGAIAEGQKDESQIVKELMPVILPGSADSLGTAQVVEIDAHGFKSAFAANNDSGYVVVADEASGTVVYAINAFGDVKAYDLEGNEVNGASADAMTAFATLAVKNLEMNKKRAEAAVGEGAVLTEITSLSSFGSVTGAFTAIVDEQTYYAFNTRPFGYSNEVMEMVVVIDSNGKIVKYKTVSDLILHEEYYSSHQLTDKDAYRAQFTGLDAESFSDDMTMVAGATMTGHAVKDSIRAAFDAYKTVKEAE